MAEPIKNLQEIRNKIRDSKIGERLAHIERWSKFRTNESTSDWLTLLGPTAIVLTHQEYFVDFVIRWSETLASEIQAQLVLAGSIHDLGEAVIGDIAAPDKTADEEIDEHQQAALALLEIGFEKSQELALSEAYQQVIAGENQALHFLFKAFERAEYLDTAIHLFSALKNGTKMEKGQSMMARVLAFDLPQIIDFATQLPTTIGNYLDWYKTDISEMFHMTHTAVDVEFADQFAESLLKWQQFCQLYQFRQLLSDHSN